MPLDSRIIALMGEGFEHKGKPRAFTSIIKPGRMQIINSGQRPFYVCRGLFTPPTGHNDHGAGE
jgi:hypothetical protein